MPSRDYYSPGSLLNVSLDSKSPLTYGLPADITVWSEQSPSWDAPSHESVANYPQRGILASGWLLGEPRLAGRSALVNRRVGAGHVVLFGFRPQYRAKAT